MQLGKLLIIPIAFYGLKQLRELESVTKAPETPVTPLITTLTTPTTTPPTNIVASPAGFLTGVTGFNRIIYATNGNTTKTCSRSIL